LLFELKNCNIRRFSLLARALPLTKRRLLFMQSNIITKTAKGIGLGIFMAFGVLAFTSTEASAQYRNNDDQQERRDDRQDRRNDRDNRDEDRYDRNDDRDYRNDNRYDRNRNSLYRVARENGYRDGQAEARDDRRDRDRNNPQRSEEYRSATNGYNQRLGSRGVYKQAYRQAFLEGYNSVINRNGRGRYNRNGY
jgi:hypothetical protein